MFAEALGVAAGVFLGLSLRICVARFFKVKCSRGNLDFSVLAVIYGSLILNNDIASKSTMAIFFSRTIHPKNDT
jgi:hypothetical protein